MDSAVKLTEDLLATVRQEAERLQSYGYGRGRPGYNGVSVMITYGFFYFIKHKKKKHTK